MSPIVAPTDRELDRRRQHFEIERRLADRLRTAPKGRRQRLYQEVYDELFRRVELPGDHAAQSAQVGPLLRLLAPFVSEGTRFAEFGAGQCDLSLALCDRVDRVWAVDAVDPQLDPVDLPPAFEFVSSLDVAARIPHRGVDVALSCHFVEHLHPEDLADHLTQVMDLLRDGGIYVVVTPNRIYGPHDISRGFTDRATGLHLQEYCHYDLARALRQAGFGRVRAFGRLGARPGGGRLRLIGALERVVDGLPAGWRRAAVAAAPRHAPFRPLEQVKLAAVRRSESGSAR
ncbi:MAG: hypothetical protein PVG53_01780 [Holophagae bacterium]